MNHTLGRRRPLRTMALLLDVGAVLSACGTGSSTAEWAASTTTTKTGSSKNRLTTRAPTGSPVTGAEASSPPTPVRAAHRMFAFYHLWWDTAHWHARLGPNYPYAATPLPLPATPTGNGCTVANNYPGNQLTDVPSSLWSQADYSQILFDVTLAAHTSLAGFAVSWAGTGRPNRPPPHRRSTSGWPWWSRPSARSTAKGSPSRCGSPISAQRTSAR